MKISVHPDYFSHPSQAFEEIENQGLHPIEMNVQPVRNESHWHRFSTRIYVLEGELNITDSARKLILKAGPGALVEVPERVLHSEESGTGYAIIAGLSVDPSTLTGPVDLDPEEGYSSLESCTCLHVVSPFLSDYIRGLLRFCTNITPPLLQCQ